MYITEQHAFLSIFSERAKNSVNSWHMLACKDISHISDVLVQRDIDLVCEKMFDTFVRRLQGKSCNHSTRHVALVLLAHKSKEQPGTEAVNNTYIAAHFQTMHQTGTQQSSVKSYPSYSLVRIALRVYVCHKERTQDESNYFKLSSGF